MIKNYCFFFIEEMTETTYGVRQLTISCHKENNVSIIFITVNCIMSIDTRYNTTNTIQHNYWRIACVSKIL